MENYLQNKEVILSVKDLSVCFSLRGKSLHAIRGVSLDVYKGESLAIVGESGSGKSVLTKNFIGLLDKNGTIDKGEILFEGMDLAKFKTEREWAKIRGKKIAMVMQDPMTSLNPLKTVGWQIEEALHLHQNLYGEEAHKKTIEILEDVGIIDPERRYKQYPHEFSGGMRQRVVIAIAIACNPRILICDEPTTALDVTIQAQILNLIKKMKEKYQLTTIYITHDLGVVANVADRIAVMYAGDIVEVGTCDEVFYNPQHPYTWALLSSLPQLGVKGEALYSIKGTPPNLFQKIRGDAFAPRNPYALDIDFEHRPPYFDVSPTHKARTWLLDPRAPKIEPPEQIKNIRQSVDVLTLSATPIPRTLHMSMTGIRDMSVIETPPEQRYPVQTYVMEYSEAVAREAIMKELGRGGQVFFVYNNVRGMETFAEKLKQLVPEARIAYAHGQMGERQLERTMLDFMEQQYDVLLCSTIIESGLDIPNVNTIIIYDADKMGLAQLYQLRGRVGRGARLGYAYLTFMRDKVLSDIAEKRLSAIREFTQFGAGFKIAMRDLEIRGAGNLLGPEQHGHMAAVGYDLYCKIVEGAVKEAKGEKEPVKIDTVVDIPVPASISTHYIPRESERLSMYKRIALIETRDDLYDVQDELIDRYGDIPEDTANLLNIALIKADCSRAGVTQLRIRDKEVRFVFDKQAPIDGAKLIAAAGNIAGARMTFGDTPSMVISRPKSDAAALYAMLPQFVYMLADCLSAN